MNPNADTPVAAPGMAMTLSGGGFRATLSGLGAVKLLFDLGMVKDLRAVSSVSGGSIANALLAKSWSQLEASRFSTTEFDRLVLQPFVGKVSSSALSQVLLRNVWRTLGRRNRTELLADILDEWFLDGLQLASLPPGVRWIVNAANFTTGARFSFERERYGDYAGGYVRTSARPLRLSTAVAASCAVPGVFAPLRLAGSRKPGPILMDGGAYDNTGLGAFDSESHKDLFLVSLYSGGQFRAGKAQYLPIVGGLKRANELLYRQSVALRNQEMIAKFERSLDSSGRPIVPVPPGARRGVLVGLGAEVSKWKQPGPGLQGWLRRFPEAAHLRGSRLADVPTSFKSFDQDLCWALVYHGWWLIGSALARWHPERLGRIEDLQPPVWSG